MAVYHVSGGGTSLAEKLLEVNDGDVIYVGPGTYLTGVKDKDPSLSCHNISLISEEGPFETFLKPNTILSYMSGLSAFGFYFITAKSISYRWPNNTYLERCVLSGINNVNGIFYNSNSVSCVASLIIDCKQPNYALTQHGFFYNCTFVKNTWRADLELTRNGGTLKNCLIADAPSGWSISKNQLPKNDCQDNFECDDPDDHTCFVDYDEGNFQLRSISPAVSMGQAKWLIGKFKTDLNGNPFSTKPSVGCFQYQGGKQQNNIPNKAYPLG